MWCLFVCFCSLRFFWFCALFFCVFGKVANMLNMLVFFFCFGVFWGVFYYCLFGVGRFRVRWGPKGPTSPNPSFFGVCVFLVVVFLLFSFICCFCVVFLCAVVGVCLLLFFFQFWLVFIVLCFLVFVCYHLFCLLSFVLFVCVGVFCCFLYLCFGLFLFSCLCLCLCLCFCFCVVIVIIVCFVLFVFYVYLCLFLSAVVKSLFPCNSSVFFV